MFSTVTTLLLLLAFQAETDSDAFLAAKKLGKGVNLGNMLEAPTEGAWGLRVEADYFPTIKQAGFDHVRIPVRWSAHIQGGDDVRIDPAFARRVDFAIDQSLKNGLAVVLNVHHYEEVDQDPTTHLPRLRKLWARLGERYQELPVSVYFELLNEPHGKLDEPQWSNSLPDLLATVRETNPNRFVIIGPTRWNNVTALPTLKLPPEDRRIIATFHYYSPFEFTHQGASWVANSGRWKGTTWTATDSQLAAVRGDFDKAQAWSKANQRPLYLGEFGAFSAADMNSRASWTRAIVREAEARGFAWCYWEFASGFGAFDPQTKDWRDPLLSALIPGSASARRR